MLGHPNVAVLVQHYAYRLFMDMLGLNSSKECDVILNDASCPESALSRGSRHFPGTTFRLARIGSRRGKLCHLVIWIRQLAYLISRYFCKPNIVLVVQNNEKRIRSSSSALDIA